MRIEDLFNRSGWGFIFMAIGRRQCLDVACGMISLLIFWHLQSYEYILYYYYFYDFYDFDSHQKTVQNITTLAAIYPRH